MAVTGLTRELSITYNGYECGGGTGRLIHGFTVQDASKNSASITFDVVITGSSQSDFGTECDRIEKAYRTPYRDLTVSLGSKQMISASQSANTGLDAIASIEKLGGPPDSGRSRRYRIHIDYGLPATWAATSGLRDSSVSIGKTVAGRTEVILRGVFTAVGGNDALAQHDAQIDGWAADQLSRVGITPYELVQETASDVTINRKTMSFERVYRELIYPQAGSSNDSAIREQVLVITRTKRGAEYSPSDGGSTGNEQYAQAPGGTAAVEVTPLVDIVARYSCWIDKDVTQDLKSKWDDIESWVIGEIQAALGGKPFGLMALAPSWNFDENRIDAQVVGIAQDADGGPLIQNVVETTTVTNPGMEVVPVWDGNPESGLVFQGMQTHVETVTRRYRQLSDAAGAAPAAPAPAKDSRPGWILLSHSTGVRPLAIGRKGYTIAMEERWTSTVWRRVTKVA